MKNFVIPAGIKGLIFDCDGTIADTMPLHYEAYVKVLGEAARYFTKQMFFDQAGVPAEPTMELLRKKYNLQFDAAKVAHEKEKLYGRMLQHVKSVAAVEAIVREQAGKMPMAVASGGTLENVKKTLDIVGLANFFQAVVSVEEVQHGKPAPDMFLEAARRMDVPPEQCLVFEDAVMGFEAADAAGMQWVDVRPWYQKQAGNET